MQFDFSFDERVAQRYNAQRAHPAQVSQQIGQAIAAEAGTGARVLEIGVGTGRIALPVALAGCHVVGFDLSLNMLAGALRLERPLTTKLDFFQADMHTLPFADNSFDAVLAVHVLHLASDLPAVLRNVARVLRPGGAFIQGDDWMDPASVVGMLRDEMRRKAMTMSPDMKPPSAGISKEKMLADLGATAVTETVVAEWQKMVSPAERLSLIENRMDAESWFLPAPVFDVLFRHLQEYATEHWLNLEEKQPVTRRFILKVSRGNW